MEETKLASVAAIFDRNFYKGFCGGVPDVKESKMLISQRSENEEWAPGRWCLPSETYDSEKDGNYKILPAKVMKEVVRRGFVEEFKPDIRLGLPFLDYIGNYEDEKTGFRVYTFMGYLWTNTPWFPRKNVKALLHPNEEVPTYDLKTLPEVIKMKKQETIAGGRAIDLVVQEIEKRIMKDPFLQLHPSQLDVLSRLD
jgi:hypothetical protein